MIDRLLAVFSFALIVVLLGQAVAAIPDWHASGSYVATTLLPLIIFLASTGPRSPTKHH